MTSEQNITPEEIQIDPKKLLRMYGKIREIERKNLRTSEYTHNDLRGIIKKIIIEEEAKCF